MATENPWRTRKIQAELSKLGIEVSLFFRADELAYTGNQKVQIEPLKQAALRRLREEGAEIQGYRFGPA